MTLFTDYLLQTDTSVYEFFEGKIYSQPIRTKNRSFSLEIINPDDFFECLANIPEEQYREDCEAEVRDNLMAFFLDKNY